MVIFCFISFDDGSLQEEAGETEENRKPKKAGHLFGVTWRYGVVCILEPSLWLHMVYGLFPITH